MRNLDTPKENTWCPGCGNFGILNAFKKTVKAFDETGMSLSNLVIVCGIGCHGKIFDYLNISGFYSLHGRAVATAEGIKLANPELEVITFGGDGDSLGEGLEHTLFAAKRNMDMTLILHSNGTYGLTTGQFSPLSPAGYKGLSAPFGSIERSFNAISLLIEAGATFVARTYSARLDHMVDIFDKAIRHKGFSFVEVLQPCVSYNNTYSLYNEKVKRLEVIPEDDATAVSIAKNKEDIYIGIYKSIQIPVYHELLYGQDNPARERLNVLQRKQIIRETF